MVFILITRIYAKGAHIATQFDYVKIKYEISEVTCLIGAHLNRRFLLQSFDPHTTDYPVLP